MKFPFVSASLRMGWMVTCLLSFSICKAQINGFISFSGGFSSPTGKFASKEIYDSEAGLANLGGSFEISGGKRLVQMLGLMVSFRYHSNPFSTTEIQNALNADIQTQIQAGNLPQGTRISLTAEPWKTMTFMAGMYLEIPLNKKLALTPRALIGMMNAQTPSITSVLTAPNYQSQKNTISSDKGSGLALGMGISGRVDFSNQIGLLLNVDYLTSEPKVGSYSYLISTITFGGGIACLF